MDTLTRHRKIWRLLYRPISFWLRRKLNYTPEICRVEGPCLVVPNHVTAWDPLLVALSFPDNQMYFVASEHIFRWGLLTKLIEWLVAPIPRRKGASGTDTVMTCIRRIRKGASIGLFAGGDCSWNGRSSQVFPATGKLARACGATLVTYRLEGGYLSAPRWGKGVRRGAMRGHVVQIYVPEQLKAMTADEVNAAINRDIYEDAWQRQAAEHAVFAGKSPAEHIECLLYACPGCGQVGGLTSQGAYIRCRCGFSRRFTETGTFAPDEPFRNPGEWDAWQRQRLLSLRPGEGGELFSDSGMILTEILSGHRTRAVGTGIMRQYSERLLCGGENFPLSEISGMSIHGAQTLTFSFRDRYYEVSSKSPRCLRKYLDIWEDYTRRYASSCGETPKI